MATWTVSTMDRDLTQELADVVSRCIINVQMKMATQQEESTAR